MPPSSKPSATKQRNEAKAQYEAEVYRFRAKKLASINAEFDALDPNKSTGKRRAARIETESDERFSLTAQKRLKSVNYTRDSERNFAPVKAMLRQISTNVIGTGVKLRLNLSTPATVEKPLPKARAGMLDRIVSRFRRPVKAAVIPDDPLVALGNEIASWFNSTYAKECDGRSDLNLAEQAALVLKSFIREGDAGVYFHSDGKLYYFESDQFVEIVKSEWDKQTLWVEDVVAVEGGKTVTKKLPLLQEQGVIYNRLGKVIAYSVSAKRGISSAKLAEVSIIPVSEFRLIKSSYRLNQLRGVSELLPCVADCLDLYAMRASEIQSAKATAQRAITITKVGALEDSLMRSGTDTEGLGNPIAPASGVPQTYEALEEYAGGMVEYLEPGESAELLKNDRPNNGLKDFFGFVLGGAGASIGLAKTYVDLNCEKSYFAARGDMLLTWQMFYVLQKFMERHFFDWIAEKAIEYFAPQMGWTLPENWQAKISWIFPTMPLLDEKKKADTDALNLDNLLTDYSELLGPDWREKLAQRKEQEDYLATLGLARINKTTGGGAPEIIDAGETENEK